MRLLFVIPELDEPKRIAFGGESSSGISLVTVKEIPAFAGMTIRGRPC